MNVSELIDAGKTAHCPDHRIEHLLWHLAVALENARTTITRVHMDAKFEERSVFVKDGKGLFHLSKEDTSYIIGLHDWTTVLQAVGLIETA